MEGTTETTQYIGKYLGPNQIVELELQDFKTPGGQEIFLVKFKPEEVAVDKNMFPESKSDVMLKNIDPSLYTAQMLAQVVMDESTDHNSLAFRRSQLVVKDFLISLAEWNLKYNEVDHVIQMLAASNQDNIDKAASFLYGADSYERTLMHTHRVLLKEKAAKANGSSGENSGGTNGTTA